MRVRIDHARQQPTLSYQLGPGDGIRSPPVAIGIKINRPPLGKGDTTYPQNRHHATSAPARGIGMVFGSGVSAWLSIFTTLHRVVE
jgi:hypothetical protein